MRLRTNSATVITALVCDLRMAGAGDLQFALNEVRIGIPMACCLLRDHQTCSRHFIGHEMTLFGQVYDLSAAQHMGVVNRIVPSERLIDEAVAWAGAVESGCHAAYAFTKRALQAATLRAIDDARRLDLDLLASRMIDPGSLRPMRVVTVSLRAEIQHGRFRRESLAMSALSQERTS
jgi:enoyl-CoA hydratase/carnithine racemase